MSQPMPDPAQGGQAIPTTPCDVCGVGFMPGDVWNYHARLGVYVHTSCAADGPVRGEDITTHAVLWGQVPAAHEVTPAVRRAADRPVFTRTGGARLEQARDALAAGLDVEEMARAADPEAFEDHPIERRSHVALLQWSVRRKIATDHARGIRAAILGPDVAWQGDGVRAVASDLAAVDDEEDE